MNEWEKLSLGEKIFYGGIGIVGGVAYLGGKAVLEGGKLVAKGVKTFADDWQLKEEIEASNAFCAEIDRNFKTNAEHYKRDFKTIREDYLRIVDNVRKQFDTLNTLEKIYFDREVSAKNFSESNMNKFLVGNEDKQVTFDGSTAIKSGFGAGLGVGVSAVGLMTAFGTAGTGAAISGLTGTAYAHALLAALGGGTLASGGLGMAGGAAVLGVAFFLPAIAVAGLVAHNQIADAHKKATAQRAAYEKRRESDKIYFAGVENGFKILREMNHEFYRSAEFFQHLVALSFTAPEIGCDENYRKILRDTAQVVQTYGSMKVVDKNDNLNENLNAEVSATKKSFERCFERYIEFRTKISPQVLELTERLKNLELQPLKDEEIRQRFDKAVESAQVELDITAMKLNYVADRYIPKFQALLERGVKIKIFYGIGEENADENRKTNETAERLEEIFRNYPNFKIKRTDTHAKVFICDDKFLVLSSYNVLSKDGKRYTFGEAGLLSNDAELIAHHRKEYFNF